MVFCANCGKQLEDDANFCSRCGTRTPNGVKEGVAIPWTETQVKQDVDRALKKASAAIDEGVKTAQVALQDVAKRIDEDVKNIRERRSAKPAQAVVFCPACGAENEASNKFCWKCGAALQ